MVNRFAKFSDWSRVVSARLKKFLREFKGVQPRTNETTSLEERKEAEIIVIKLVQEEAFAEDIQRIKLQKDNTLSKHNNLHQLDAFMDKNGVLRVGGRLVQSSLHHNIKHPATLPKKSHLSTLLIKHHHKHV